MNTRGLSKRSKPTEGRFPRNQVEEEAGLHLLQEFRGCTIKFTKWECPVVVNHLGIGSDFNTLITNMGL
jgi:hypothetical protein